MTFQHICNPCEYLLFDNVCTPELLNSCFNEAKLIEPAFKEPSETGSATTDCGKIKKQNSGIFLNEVYAASFATYSPIVSSFNNVFKTAKNKQYTALSQMNYLSKIAGYNILLSAYKDGDFYESHTDLSVLTVLFWFGEHDNKGGDLIFTQFNHTVSFVSNRAIIFPSYYEHKVSKIETSKDKYVRYSVTALLCIDGMPVNNQPTTTGTAEF